MSAQDSATGTISGRVTAHGGVGAPGVVVFAYVAADHRLWEIAPGSGSYETDGSGTYTLEELPAGTYRVGFLTESGILASEAWNDAVSVEDAADVVRTRRSVAVGP